MLIRFNNMLDLGLLVESVLFYSLRCCEEVTFGFN